MPAIASCLIFLAVFSASSQTLINEDLSDLQISILEPPVKPTIIQIGVSLVQVIHIEPASVENPKMTAQFKIRTHWQDDRLIAPPSDQRAVHAFQDEEATAKLGQIFDPRMAIIDGTTTVNHQHLRIYPNGAVSLSQVVTVTTPANMDLKHFPFDTQVFAFRFASTFWDDTEIDLILDPMESSLVHDAAPSSWQFDYGAFHITRAAVRAHSETFYIFNFLVHAQRDPRYFIWRLLLPLIVIVILSWNVFWMYEDAASALGNCFVFLLTVVSFHQIANEQLPQIPFFTFMDSIVFISYGFIIIPTFQVMVTTKLERQGMKEKAESIRKWCRWIVPMGFAISILSITLGYFATT